MTPESNPVKPGNATSEKGMAMLGVIFGAVLSGATVTLGILVERFPDAGWLGVLAGAVSVAASVLGYSASRAKVKAADILVNGGSMVSPVTQLKPVDPPNPP
jgi:hypothetical protein